MQFASRNSSSASASASSLLLLSPSSSKKGCRRRRFERVMLSSSSSSSSNDDDGDTLTITRPDDWHLHLRDGAKINSVVPFTARQFRRALVMPNLTPPVRDVEDATRYRELILSAAQGGGGRATTTEKQEQSLFEPHMTLYLADNTTEEIVENAARTSFCRGFKLYPAGATINSSFGVTNVKKVLPALRAIAKHDLVLQVHGEVTHDRVDFFDREATFIEEVLKPLLDEVPELRVVMEHITTKNAADFVSTYEGSGVSGSNSRLAATITPQHVLLNRNSLFKGGLRPHHFCLPILKREEHREAVLAAATSDSTSEKFFLGTDSAPHPKGAKEAACSCAGIFSAHAALQFYAMAFESVGKLDKLEGFASHNGADFYKLPRNEGTITLKRGEWEIPETYEFGGDVVVPFYAGQKILWTV